MRGLLFILLLYAVAENFIRAQKAGKCPDVTPNDQDVQEKCRSGIDRCRTDSDCEDDSKCCSDSCVRTCATPIRTGCHQLKRQLERQPLGDGFVPECTEDGRFQQVQCVTSGDCWCVDGRGFELAGTRAGSLDGVNCTRPKGCAGFLCRMLCPYGFELDPEGCPLCECRNPCKKVKCPAGQECSLEDVPCADHLCPPLPTCKRPRTLESQCPLGEPIVSPDTKNPFLCGMQPNKPQCPLNYVCNIQRGNDYGVCCPLLDKPGQCPRSNATSEEGKCPTPCEMDAECQSSGKCCHTEDCGKVCLPPGNTTLCEQQKAVVQLLVGSNPDYAAYIPQCNESGEFLRKQCTTSGKLCWCIDERGAQVRGTLGPGETVSCLEEVAESRQSNNVSSCPEISCAAECPFGYKSDADGCRLCECFQPCKEIDCPSDAECVILKEDPCVTGSCPPIATCMRRPSPKSSCKEGTSPLMDERSGEIRKCSDDDCPSAYRCHLLPDQDVGICCPMDKPPGGANAETLRCPKMIERPDICPNSTCESDLDCQGGSKCCSEPSCGSICVSAKPVRLPTMCEYLRDVGHKLGSSNESLAFPVPSCRTDGSYEPVQCDGAPCWCVDEFGAELPGTRVDNGETVNCNEARSLKPCLGLLCRLGCDYGFEMDSEGCPVCECRNPCSGSKCPAGRECRMVPPQDCREGWCPAVPQCITNEVEGRAPPGCLVGRPMLYEENDAPVTCDPTAPYQLCPVTHMCISETNSGRGVCCPRLDNEVDSSSVAAESERRPVVGQCPYLVPPASPSDTCDFECAADADCGEGRKCCSSGCGTQCTRPLLMTACQHRKYIAEHVARETGTPASRMHVPECRSADGGFEKVQCDGISTCWCVGDGGLELPGSRSQSRPNCTVAEECPAGTECPLECPYGFQIGADGCPVCACNDPCQGVTCRGLQESCQVVIVSCTSLPCPPVALCLPPRDNPCATGEPLTDQRCGPTEGSQCPSSHRCHLDPLVGSLGLCCPKPREVCQQTMRVGTCRSSQPRWFFDKDRNSCQPFLYGGCGGNLNNFQTQEECQMTCPVVTSQCERIRERNLKIRKSYNKIVYIPKCSRKTGAWEPVQCLDAVGLCWCVDPDGEQVPGSVVRGTPSCSQRGARQSGETAICPDGESVHPCPEDLCSHATCLARPNSTCRINPCGSCRAEFFDWRNRPVECSKGLTACLGEMDRVLQVAAWQSRHRQARSTLVGEEMTSVTLDGNEEVVEEQVRLIPDRPVTVTSGIAVIIGPRLRSLLERGMAMAVVKPGVCPHPSLMTMLRGLGWNCRHGCMLDAHCPGPKKCCLGSCGLECLDPVGPTPSQRPAFMSAPTPNCSSEGGYAVVQRQGELSWCVDKYGNPFEETFTRGSVECLKNGSLVERVESGPVCPGRRKPVVCRNQCLDSSCPQHPEAVCVADPCDGCSVRFVDSQGNDLRCEDKCHQPIEKGSSCSHVQTETRFGFGKRKCQEFLYAGCDGNDNNFRTLRDCRQACEEPRPVCEQPRETGLCRAFWVRWFYNRNTHRCEKFVYGGCGGNANNFETKEQCEAVCPDRVFCPWSTLHEELEGCSRSEACVNSTCSGHRSSVCTVDPCTCRPVFVDTRGDPVDCKGLPDLVMPEVSALTRCQHRRLHGDGAAPQCAGDGSFFPTQCPFGGQTEEHCWCVDEAGNQLPDSNPQQCRFVRVKSVRATVNLRHDPTTSNDPSLASEIKLLSNRLLERLGVEPPRDLLVETTNTDATRVTFTLLDDKKVDTAFKLEEMVKSGNLKLMLTKGTLTADYKSSHFYYVTDYVPPDVEVFANTIPDTHMALGSGGSNSKESATVLVAVVVATSVLTILLLLTLVVLYRRKRLCDNKDLSGRRSFVTLMFSSPLYDLITRKSQTKTNPYDAAAKEKPPIPTVESEYETIQNELNSAKQPANPVPPAYEEIAERKAP